MKLDGILGGYSLHILQPLLGGGGVFWVSSDLNSGKKFRAFHFLGGGVLGKLRLGFWEQFQFWEGGVLEPNSRTGCSREFGQKFLEA